MAQAQTHAKIPKIGWLSAQAGTNRGQTTIVSMLRQLGHIDGKNILFEYRYTGNQPNQLPVLADELVRLNVDLLITPGTSGALALKNATRTIPIVFLDVTDPVAAGLVDSLARPGGNITGFTSIEAVLAGKRLEILKETIPKLSRVAVLWNPQDPSSAQQWKECQSAAQKIDLQLYSMEVSRLARLESALKETIKARSGALFVASSALAASNAKAIAELVQKYRLPAIYTQSNYVSEGGLISYGADQEERFRRAAYYIDRLLNGTKPTDLPVEQPTKFELVINMKAAKVLGLKVPNSILVQATKVIK